MVFPPIDCCDYYFPMGCKKKKNDQAPDGESSIVEKAKKFFGDIFEQEEGSQEKHGVGIREENAVSEKEESKGESESRLDII